MTTTMTLFEFCCDLYGTNKIKQLYLDFTKLTGSYKERGPGETDMVSVEPGGQLLVSNKTTEQGSNIEL